MSIETHSCSSRKHWYSANMSTVAFSANVVDDDALELIPNLRDSSQAQMPLLRLPEDGHRLDRLELPEIPKGTGIPTRALVCLCLGHIFW